MGRPVTWAATLAQSFTLSIGNSAYLGRAIVGHIDTSGGSSFTGFRVGHTYFAVSRNDPHGDGELVTTGQTVFSSAGLGYSGDELRLYMPNSARNGIATGTYLNTTRYTRTPEPGGPGRTDEQEAAEHRFSDPFDIGSAQFAPEGDYPFHGFGFYNIYYSGVLPPNPPVAPGTGGGNGGGNGGGGGPVRPGPVLPGPFDFHGWVFDRTYDQFAGLRGGARGAWRTAQRGHGPRGDPGRKRRSASARDGCGGEHGAGGRGRRGGALPEGTRGTEGRQGGADLLRLRPRDQPLLKLPGVRNRADAAFRHTLSGGDEGRVSRPRMNPVASLFPRPPTQRRSLWRRGAGERGADAKLRGDPAH